jgi:hypothetical protein
MYSGLKRVKKQHRVAATIKMIDGVEQMKLDAKEGRCYASGIIAEDDKEGEGPARKRARGQADNLRTSPKECKCGAQDHQRVTSRNCPWKGLPKKEIMENYERRLKEWEVREKNTMATSCTDPTEEIVQSTSEFLAPMQTRNYVTPKFGIRRYATLSQM